MDMWVIRRSGDGWDPIRAGPRPDHGSIFMIWWTARHQRLREAAEDGSPNLLSLRLFCMQKIKRSAFNNPQYVQHGGLAQNQWARPRWWRRAHSDWFLLRWCIKKISFCCVILRTLPFQMKSLEIGSVWAKLCVTCGWVESFFLLIWNMSGLLRTLCRFVSFGTGLGVSGREPRGMEGVWFNLKWIPPLV